MVRRWESADKPGSVENSHSSGIAVTERPQATYPGARVGTLNTPLFGLAPGGVYPAARVTTCAVRSYRTISPLPGQSLGGIFSVALSVGSRPPGVTWRLCPWSPDFPPNRGRFSDCLADSRRTGYAVIRCAQVGRPHCATGRSAAQSGRAPGLARVHDSALNKPAALQRRPRCAAAHR